MNNIFSNVSSSNNIFINDITTSRLDFTNNKTKYVYNPSDVVEYIYIHPELRKTSEVMTKYEYTNVISIRADHIQKNDKCFTNTENISDPIEMAKKEIEDKKCPLSILRNITDNIYEIWQVNEMVIPNI